MDSYSLHEVVKALIETKENVYHDVFKKEFSVIIKKGVLIEDLLVDIRKAIDSEDVRVAERAKLIMADFHSITKSVDEVME